MNRNYMNANMSSGQSRMMRNYTCPQESVKPAVMAPSSCHRTDIAGDGNCCSDIPVGNKKQLLCYINEVSFAVYETLLYLDTHPDDYKAVCFFREHNKKREMALKEYAHRFGPLTISTADDEAGSSWAWMCEPWPWEGGDC